MSEFAIEVKHLDKMYKLYNKPSDRLREALGFKVPVREHYALRDVNFEVKRGETVGFTGTVRSDNAHRLSFFHVEGQTI